MWMLHSCSSSSTTKHPWYYRHHTSLVALVHVSVLCYILLIILHCWVNNLTYQRPWILNPVYIVISMCMYVLGTGARSWLRIVYIDKLDFPHYLLLTQSYTLPSFSVPLLTAADLPHTILLTSYAIVMTGVLGRWYGRRSLAICQLIRKFGSRVTGDRMAGISGRGYDDIWSSSGWWMYQVGFSLLITLCQSHQSLCDTKLCHNARYIYARIRMKKVIKPDDSSSHSMAFYGTGIPLFIHYVLWALCIFLKWLVKRSQWWFV